MKSPIARLRPSRRPHVWTAGRRGARGAAALVAMAVTALVLSVAGCAEEDAEGFEAAYPVGATVPPPDHRAAIDSLQAPPAEGPSMVGPAQAPPSTPGPDGPAPESDDGDGVAVGDDSSPDDTGPRPEGAPPAGDEGQAPAYSDTDPSALTDFHAALDQYGAWVDDPTYGTVWVPSSSAVGPDFTPYSTAGHWSYDSDYTWVSDYGWGWAPFHYGRWVYSGPAGWAWVPGRAYAGAWVSWRYGWDDWAYVGWAPLPPTWGWRRGVAVGLGFVPVAPYAFVSSGDLFSRQLGSHVVGGARTGAIAAHTRPWMSGSGVATGHALAHPSVGGPPPSMLRIPQAAIVRTTANRGVAQARAFARPGFTGLAATRAAGPAGFQDRSTRTLSPAYGPAAGFQDRSARTLAPAYGPAAPSHFGGRLLGAGFTGNAAASRATRGPAAMGPRPYFGPPSAYPSGAQGYRGGSASMGGGRYGGTPSAAAYSGGRAEAAAAPGGFRGGSIHVGGGVQGSGGAVQGGGEGAIQSGGGFRGGGVQGGGGGFQGGGGGFHGGGVSRGGGGRGGGRR
jgi:hypothetical protein